MKQTRYPLPVITHDNADDLKICKSSFSTRIINLILVLSTLAFVNFTSAQNAIVTENQLQGNPATEWDITGAGDLSIQGFATDISVNKGETVHFKIKTDADDYTVSIYRLGYYGGMGARKVGTGVITATLPQTQPDVQADPVTGLTDCGTWAESAHWDVPTNAVSGVYIARLERSGGGASHIVFIVRDDASHSDLFFKTSDATWQAYNVYGGASLYVGNTSLPSGHASKVSYNRPFLTRNGGGEGGGEGGESEDWLFNAEYPMIRWLERNGYDMTYTTDLDGARRGDLILNHKVFMSVGHDEYWSSQQRENVEAARNAGVHLAFFSGNEVYWKTRWEPSTDGTNTPYRTLVCYKEGTLGENQCNTKCDPELTAWTGLWRDGDPAVYGATDGFKPENALTGQISWDGTTSTIQVPSTYKNLRFWRNTSITALGTGDIAPLATNSLGYEWDWEQYPQSLPAGRFTLSSTTINGHTHKLSLYRHSSGALVFGAGTVQWSWGLDGTHDRGGSTPNQDMQQATVNLFADMGVQPGTLQTELTATTASADNSAPASVITSPNTGSSKPKGQSVTITGTASDAGGGVVAGIEVSVDGGNSWRPATGTTNWNYSWTPATEGAVTIKSRSVDDNGNLESATNLSNQKTITVTSTGTNCPCTVFQPGDGPSTPKDNDGSAIEVGFKFQASEDGYITAIRFYKGAGTTGTHSGHLWSNNGTLLSSITFNSESASGWQEAALDNPVAITANTSYIASVFSSSGDYPSTNPFFTQPVVNGPLTALANGEDGPNGLYKYTQTPAFPIANFQTSNYWVDVVFNTNVGPDITTPTVTATTPTNGAAGVSTNSTINIIFSEAVSAATVNNNTIVLRDGSNDAVSSTVTYNNITHTASIAPSPLAYSSNYTVIVKGGNTDPRIKDISGNALENNYSFSFTTGAPPPPPPTEGLGGPILVVSSTSNPFSRYPVEILRAEGLNEFDAVDISQVTSSVLSQYDVVVLGEMSLSAANVTMLTDWTTAGGTLIAFKPDIKLASLMGISATGNTLSNRYLLVDNSTAAGKGIVNQTIQYHGPADLYTLNGATSIATLYTDASTATQNPAVTTHAVGSNGGTAIAFTYDLARSVVYTRQGNPAWAGQKRDGQIEPIRSDDLFFPDWIDFSKIAIPQADEQQHLLSNLIIHSNLHRKPLPKFWFLPKGHKAAIVMTGDNHGDAGIKPRFDIHISESPEGCNVDDWECIRSTGYLYVGPSFTDAQAKQYTDMGFEVSLHVNTDCQNITPGSYQNIVTTQLTDFQTAFPSIPAPATNRNHCLVWSDWSTVPETEAAKGIRLDVNYYYWPGSWVQNRSGMFTGSGMPMRFAKDDGTLIDCYQAVTQMPDESDLTFPTFCDELLDRAIGQQGYYGVFTTNMHIDHPDHPDDNAIVASAKARGVPVVSAKQMLNWLDGRNSSAFGAMTWSNNTLSFTIAPGTGARNLQCMLPVAAASGLLTTITKDGSPVVILKREVIKGIEYAFFNAAAGTFEATYVVDNTAPVISTVNATPNADGSATITWKTDENADSKVDFGTTANTLNQNVTDATPATDHVVTLTGLTPGITYYYRVTSADAASNAATSPMPLAAPLSFVIPTHCVNDIIAEDFNAGTVDANTLVSLEGDGAVILKPTLNEDFSGNTVPAGWTADIFNSGGSTTVSNGSVTVSGAHISSNSNYAPGSSIEFNAKFNAGTFQNVGFTVDQAFDGAPWIVIGQGESADGNLYARTSGGNAVNLGSKLLGATHRFRIKWNPTSFEFYVDGNSTPAATINQTVNQNMFVQISDVIVSDGALSVDWVRVAPYATSGVYTSRVFDGGESKKWEAVSWSSDLPAGTGISISVRNGDNPIPDGGWTAFTPITASGNSAGVSSRYIQYKADLQTSNTSASPVLKGISIGCSENKNLPEITVQPQSQTLCSGTNVVFSSVASGVPEPSVQWQISTDGVNWTDIAGETNSSLIFTTTNTDNNKRYRAVWSNTAGIVNSSAAILTVNAIPVVTASTLAASSCADDGSITLHATGGNAPYAFNLNMPNNFVADNHFAGLPAATYTGYVQDNAGCFGSLTNIVVTKSEPIAISVSQTTASSCADDGTISVNATGGTLPFTYSLDGNTYVTSNTFTGLAGGSYTVYAKDARNCISTLPDVVVSKLSSVIVSASTSSASSCANDGTITVSATGGTPPFSYSLDGTNYVSTNTFVGLAAGTYTAYVKDLGNCVSTLTNIEISQVAPIVVNASKTAASSCADDGTLTISASGGISPFTYSLDGNSFVTTNTFTGLAAGTYTAYVKDAQSCVQSLSNVVVTKAATITVSATKTAASGCADDGTITVNATGGTSPFTYSLDGTNYVTTNTFTGLAAGTYTAYVKDLQSCVGTLPNIVISKSTSIIVSASKTNASSCANDGTITVSATGGAAPYTFSLNGTTYVTNNTFTGLAAGTYTAYVKDSKGCTQSLSNIVVSKAAPIVVSVSKTNASSCANDGTITVNRTGGVSPFTYSLDGTNYVTTNTFTGLASGTYTAYVKDAKNCVGSLSNIVVSKLAPIAISATKTSASSCANDGTITVGATGGAAPYTYSLDGINYVTTNKFTGLASGTYTAYVKDSRNCVQLLSNISVPKVAAITVSASKTAASSCANDGTITVNRTGGTSPFTYSLDGINYVSTNTFTGLAGGTYTAYVKDAKNCVGSLSNIVVSKPAPIVVSVSKTNASSCANDGTITVNRTGGTSPFTYSLNGTSYVTSNKFTGLAAGTYTAYVKDAKNCVGLLSNVVVTKLSFSVTTSKTNVTCKGANNGTINVNRSGGVAPITYSLNGINYVNTSKFTGLAPGTYTAYAKDARGCIVTATGITITESSKICSSVLITQNAVEDTTGSVNLIASVRPNPSVNEFTLVISGNNKENVDIRIIDIYGRVIRRFNGAPYQSYRFGHDFASGTYLVEIVQGANRKVLKVVKQ